MNSAQSPKARLGTETNIKLVPFPLSDAFCSLPTPNRQVLQILCPNHIHIWNHPFGSLSYSGCPLEGCQPPAWFSDPLLLLFNRATDHANSITFCPCSKPHSSFLLLLVATSSEAWQGEPRHHEAFPSTQTACLSLNLFLETSPESLFVQSSWLSLPALWSLPNPRTGLTAIIVFSSLRS